MFPRANRPPAEASGPARLRLAIRRYRDEDHDVVWHLHNVALEPTGAHGGNGAWDEDLHHIAEVYFAGGDFLVGVVEGEIVAMGALRRKNGDCAELKRMRVHPDVQRRGFGQQMLEALEKRAVELGYSHLWLDTTTLQTAAHGLYRKNSFVEVGRGQVSRFDLVFYEKNLAP